MKPFLNAILKNKIETNLSCQTDKTIRNTFSHIISEYLFRIKNMLIDHTPYKLCHQKEIMCEDLISYSKSRCIMWQQWFLPPLSNRNFPRIVRLEYAPKYKFFSVIQLAKLLNITVFWNASIASSIAVVDRI